MDDERKQRIAEAMKTDWTIDPETGKSNSSEEFLRLVDEVARLMRSDYHLGDDPRRTARLIIAQLAHKHHLAPPAAGAVSHSAASESP